MMTAATERLAVSPKTPPEPPASASSNENGSCSTNAATETTIPASSRIPSTRQKLRRTSRHDLASAVTGPWRSSTTTGTDRLNMIESHTVTQNAAMPARTPKAIAAA